MRILCLIFVFWGLVSAGLANTPVAVRIFASDGGSVPTLDSPENMEQKAKWVAEQTLVSDADLKLATFYWNGMFEGRYRLKSGHLRLKREIEYTEERKKTLPLDVLETLPHVFLYDFYFDYTKDLYRFARKSGNQKHVFVKNRDVTLFYDGIATIKNTPTSESPHYLAIPFDARHVGLLNKTAFNSPNRAQMIDNSKRFFESPTTRVIDVQMSDDDILQVTSFNESQRFPFVGEWIRQIDASRGFSLGKIQAYERFFIRGNEMRRMIQDISVDYKEFGPANDRVWLPVKSVERYYNGGQLHETVTMTLQWSHINEPLSDDHFTLKAMNVTDGIFMVDKRLGASNSIIEGQIHGGEVQLRGEAALRAIEEARGATSNRYFLFRIISMAIGVIFILAGIYLMIQESRKRKGDQNL